MSMVTIEESIYSACLVVYGKVQNETPLHFKGEMKKEQESL